MLKLAQEILQNLPPRVRNALSIVAAVAIVVVTVQKYLAGEPVNWNEALLGLSTITAALGFQYHPTQGGQS